MAWPPSLPDFTSQPLSPANMQTVVDALNYLYQTQQTINTNVAASIPAPVQRPATYDAVSGAWTTSVGYQTGKVQVYLNGVQRTKGTSGAGDWYEYDIASGKVKFNFATLTTDRVDVLDWSH